MPRILKEINVGDDTLSLFFDDGTKIVLKDEGQDCCEHRYMSCDDDLNSFVGSEYINWEVKPGPEEESDECHETAFLEITTSSGSFTVVNHNEHNGYYGGFHIQEIV